jgi:hypothetical protein
VLSGMTWQAGPQLVASEHRLLHLHCRLSIRLCDTILIVKQQSKVCLPTNTQLRAKPRTKLLKELLILFKDELDPRCFTNVCTVLRSNCGI